MPRWFQPPGRNLLGSKAEALPSLLIAALLACTPGIALAQLPTPGTDPLLSPANNPFATTSLAAPLPVDQAFPLEVLVELPATLVVKWDITEGYYLYRHGLDFQQAGESLLPQAEIPRGLAYHDEFFGEVEIYRDVLITRLPFEADSGAQVELEVSYQGCADIGFCYPPARKRVSIELP